MYKKALQQKLRFETIVGNLSVEQLFDLPINSNKNLSLKQIAVNLHEQLTKSSATGLEFLDETSKTDETLELKFAIVKDIIETKQAQASAASNKKAKESELALLQDLLAKKKNQALEELSADELEAKIKALQD